MKALFLAMLSVVLVSPSLAQRPFTEEQAIAYAKSIDVQTLDSSLPAQRLEDWLQSGPPRVHANWRLADTCDLKDPEEAPFPVCVKVKFYRDGQDGNEYGQAGDLLIRIGNSKDGVSGQPALFYPEIGVYEGLFINSGSSDRLADLPALLDLPVVTGNVQKLYLEIVAHRPIGIPSAAEMSIIKRYLSRRLTAKLQAAKACEEEYRHQETPSTSRPAWLKSGLFSGEGSHASPVDALVARKEKQSDGSFSVYVDMEPAEAVIKRSHGLPQAFHGGYSWEVVARVISEDGRFVVDDLRIYDSFPATGPSRLLSNSFEGCDGSHWIGAAASRN